MCQKKFIYKKKMLKSPLLAPATTAMARGGGINHATSSNLYGSTIRIGRESWCLLYAGFFDILGPFLVFFVNFWHSLAFFGIYWSSLPFFGVHWRLLVFFGVIWRSLAFFVNFWCSLAILCIL